MTKPKTAILWGQDDLLAQAMEIFLMDRESWEVSRIPTNECTCSLVEQVRKVKPDLVILHQGKHSDNSDPLMELIKEQPDLRLITVCLENNVMQVYSKRSITVRKVSDLLSVIEDRDFSENPV
jgi:hypothetical protein